MWVAVIRRAAWKSGETKKETGTYVSQILHYIIELVSLLEFIANLLNSLLADEVFCNFRPHSIFLGFFCFETPPSVSGIDNGEVTNFFFFTALAATDAIQGAATTSFAFEDNVFVIVLTITRATVGINVSQGTFEEILWPTSAESQFALRGQEVETEILGEVGFLGVVLRAERQCHRHSGGRYEYHCVKN